MLGNDEGWGGGVLVGNDEGGAGGGVAGNDEGRGCEGWYVMVKRGAWGGRESWREEGDGRQRERGIGNGRH